MNQQAALRLPAVLTHAQAMACEGALAAQWPKPSEQPQVWVDASALQQFDSSALAVLLSCQRRAEASGQSVHFSAAPARLLQLARLYGVAELLKLQTAVAKA